MEYPAPKIVKNYRHFIKKNGYYLSSLFPVTFGKSIPANVYWYNCQQIAIDIAKQLKADVVTIEEKPS